MEYTVNAEMTKTEYYKMFFRDYLFLYIMFFLLAFMWEMNTSGTALCFLSNF